MLILFTIGTFKIVWTNFKVVGVEVFSQLRLQRILENDETSRRENDETPRTHSKVLKAPERWPLRGCVKSFTKWSSP